MNQWDEYKGEIRTVVLLLLTGQEYYVTGQIDCARNRRGNEYLVVVRLGNGVRDLYPIEIVKDVV